MRIGGSETAESGKPTRRTALARRAGSTLAQARRHPGERRRRLDHDARRWSRRGGRSEEGSEKEGAEYGQGPECCHFTIFYRPATIRMFVVRFFHE